jgi:hypothetical protein
LAAERVDQAQVLAVSQADSLAASPAASRGVSAAAALKISLRDFSAAAGVVHGGVAHPQATICVTTCASSSANRFVVEPETLI